MHREARELNFENAEAEKIRNEEKIQAETESRLRKFGCTEAQTKQIMRVDREKIKSAEDGDNSTMLERKSHGRPTYVKVHRDHLSVDTLLYYDIPWEYDSARPKT